MLFEVKELDKKIYNEQIRDFLPNRIIDIHTHVWLNKRSESKDDSRRIARWPDLVADQSPIEDLMETYRLLFPDKKITPLIFPAVLSPLDDLEGQNRYAQQCSEKFNVPALIWSNPNWTSQELEEKIIQGKFVGLKCYLTHAPAYIPADEIRIFDTFPHHHLEVLNRHGWLMMLHIPRPGRLKDPVNLAQMMEIEQRYPNIKLIIAHVGRAYCIEDVGNAWEVLGKTQHMLFDISANTNQQVFEQLIEVIGPRRILFGSDMPILRMRARRITENGRYINIVPKGLYGDVSNDPNMREAVGKDAENITFLMYEEILAFRRAAEKTGLSKKDIEDIFYNNAVRILRPHFGKL